VKAKVLKLTEHEAFMHFEVQDTGIGVDPEVAKNLFQEFVQADASTTRRYGGTGLGLSICKGLVESMSGQIGVESQIGKGSNFWFTLQLALGSVSVAGAEEISENLPLREKPWRILVGEDNQVNQMIITKILEKFGMKVDIAGNGKEVIEAIQSRPYDLIFMDCHMPVMDGYQATSFIRESKSVINSRIPIIAMTANAMKGDRERTLQAGMDDYISKPLDIKKVKVLLSKWLQHLISQDQAV
jgi:CheY-like chemotaxis protein